MSTGAERLPRGKKKKQGYICPLGLKSTKYPFHIDKTGFSPLGWEDNSERDPDFYSTRLVQCSFAFALIPLETMWAERYV